MRYLLICFLVICCFAAEGQTYTVETVPNTKLQNNSYVSNPDNILTEATVAEINSLLSALESVARAQVAVVVVQSIGEEDIFDFAQKLFNYWAIGKAKEDNGLLILLVMDKRTVRLHTGYGLEGDLPDIVCKHIEMQKMVPHFKQQDYDTGILEGIREVVSILGNPAYGGTLRNELLSQTKTTENSEPPNASDDSLEDILDDLFTETDISEFLIWLSVLWTTVGVGVYFYKRSEGGFTDSKKFEPINTPNIKTSGKHFLVWFVGLPVSIFIAMIFVNKLWILSASLYGYFLIGAAETKLRLNSVFNDWYKKKEYHALYMLYQKKLWLWILAAVALPVPFAFLILPYKRKMKFLREHPRDCVQCKQPCTKLSEQTEDPFLNKQQQLEESIKSVDYDVWKCNACSAPQVFRYPNPFTKFDDCPKCGTIAYYVSSTRTIKSATQSSEGLKEETKLCKFCQFKNVRTFTIPKLSSSSSSSSGGSSSGGSWGGGRSGGGGASSSW
jgi:uncharacterized protein